MIYGLDNKVLVPVAQINHLDCLACGTPEGLELLATFERMQMDGLPASVFQCSKCNATVTPRASAIIVERIALCEK